MSRTCSLCRRRSNSLYHRSQSLALGASLKASQVASNIQLIETTCKSVATRILIQEALESFYAGNDTDANWAAATDDVQSALGSGGYASLYQAIIYSRNAAGDRGGILNVTSDSLSGEITLPYNYTNGSVSRLFFSVLCVKSLLT